MKIIEKSKIIVIKIGSSLLISKDKFNTKWLESLVDDIIFLNKKKIEIIIVASGAVSLGQKYLKIERKNLKIHEKQVCAACGQVILMNNFKKIFEKKKLKVAQILITYTDTEDRKNSLNSRETIAGLLKKKTIPIINENDSVATDELKFGDNDRLAARVAQIVNADYLILLSDVDGLFTSNPKKIKKVELIKEVKEINEKIFKMASSDTNPYGSGGMLTKIEAAQIASSSGCSTVICKGDKKNPIRSFLKKEKGTKFHSNIFRGNGFKKWLAGTINITGGIYLDEGAVKAINKGASILPSGIQKISGKFSKGDIINVKNANGKGIGKGVSYYDSKEIEMIKGLRSSEIKKTLGYDGREEIIHRDYLILND